MPIATEETNNSSVQQQYSTLVAAVDQAISQAAAHHLDRLQCQPGCSECCKPFSVLAVEADAMQRALATLAPAIRTRLAQSTSPATEQCPFLQDNLCLIYQQRPLICRSQGLAIAYIDHDRQAIEVSACPVNFPAEEDYPFTEQDLFFMDSFNERLAAINHDFCTETGLPPTERVPFREIPIPSIP